MQRVRTRESITEDIYQSNQMYCFFCFHGYIAQSTTKDASSQPQDSSLSINESLATFINPLAQEENQHLKSEIEDLNKRIKRLKDIFGEQMKIFKNTVYVA